MSIFKTATLVFFISCSGTALGMDKVLAMLCCWSSSKIITLGENSVPEDACYEPTFQVTLEENMSSNNIFMSKSEKNQYSNRLFTKTLYSIIMPHSTACCFSTPGNKYTLKLEIENKDEKSYLRHSLSYRLPDASTAIELPAGSDELPIAFKEDDYKGTFSMQEWQDKSNQLTRNTITKEYIITDGHTVLLTFVQQPPVATRN